jgi:hypothetical protein
MKTTVQQAQDFVIKNLNTLKQIFGGADGFSIHQMDLPDNNFVLSVLFVGNRPDVLPTNLEFNIENNICKIKVCTVFNCGVARID